MTSEIPIACSLSAGELNDRLADIAHLGRDALIDVQQEGASASLRFAPRRGVRQRLAGIVAAESSCCPFLGMRVREEPDALVLTIDAPADAELVLRELVDAFRADAGVP